VRALRLLNLRRVRRQPLRALIALASVAAGVALVAAIPVVSGSAKRSITKFGQSLAGPAPLRVIGPVARGGLDQSVLPKVEQVDGVELAVPLVQAITLAEGRELHHETVLALGITCQVEALFGAFGCSQSALDAQPANAPPLLSPSLARAAGTEGILRTDIGDVPLNAGNALPPLDRINGGRVVVMPLSLAQRRFARPNAFDVIYIKPRPGVAITDVQRRVQDAIGGWNRVLLADDPPPGANLAGSILLPLLGLMGLFALGIGAVLIRNTVALSVEERRRDFAIASAVGASTRIVRGGILTEGAALGFIGGLLGAAGGVGVAYPLASALSQFTEKFGGFRVDVSVSPFPFVFGAVVGVIVAVIASWRPARLATRIDVAAELSNREQSDEAAAALSVARGVIYTVLGIGAVFAIYVAQRHGGLEPWAPPLAQVGLLVAILLFTLAVGSLAPVAVHATRALARGRGAAAKLAWGNLTREPSRTRVMAVATASAVGIAFSLANVNQSIHTAITDSIVSHFGDRVGVSTLDPNNTINIDAKIPPDAVAAVSRLPNVDGIERSYDMLVGTKTTDLMGVSASDHVDLFLSVIKGSADRGAFERGEVLVGPALARRKHLHAGGTLRVPGRTGWADLKVQGIWQDGDFNGTKVTMPTWLLERIWGPQPAANINARPRPGVDADQLRAEIVAANLTPYLHAETKHSLAKLISSDVSKQLQPFWAMQRGLVLVSFMAVLFTLLLVAVQRRRELGLLSAVGMKPRDLARMVVLEAAIVGVIGAAFGTIYSIGFSEAFRQSAVILVGFRDPFTLDWRAPLLWVPTIVVVVAVAALFPAWRASRIDVVDALRYE
jgi:putative ABC transport system permease protein